MVLSKGEMWADTGVFTSALIVKLARSQNAVELTTPTIVGLPLSPSAYILFIVGAADPTTTSSPKCPGSGPHLPPTRWTATFPQVHLCLSLSSLQFIINYQMIHWPTPKDSPLQILNTQLPHLFTSILNSLHLSTPKCSIKDSSAMKHPREFCQ